MPHTMSSTMSPLNFLAATETPGSRNEGWSLDQAPHGSPERTFGSRITFDRPFGSTPLVHLGLATWLHTRVWRVAVNWLAIGT
jgi:hypothetical protein